MFMTVASTKVAFLVDVALVLSLPWQIKLSFDLMGNVKTILYCYLTADIVTRVLQKCSLSRPLPNIFCFVQSSEFDWLPWQQKG